MVPKGVNEWVRQSPGGEKRNAKTEAVVRVTARERQRERGAPRQR